MTKPVTGAPFYSGTVDKPCLASVGNSLASSPPPPPPPDDVFKTMDKIGEIYWLYNVLLAYKFSALCHFSSCVRAALADYHFLQICYLVRATLAKKGPISSPAYGP